MWRSARGVKGFVIWLRGSVKIWYILREALGNLVIIAWRAVERKRAQSPRTYPPGVAKSQC